MKAYIYCTKSKPTLYKQFSRYDNEGKMQNIIYHLTKALGGFPLNGKIVASFDLNKIEKMGLDTGNGLEFINGFNKESQLTLEEIANYVGDNYYYAWHIDNLEILDNPKDITSFTNHYKIDKLGITSSDMVMKAPQSWQYVYDKNRNKCILISIKSEWVCKILNGEKTIELRKTAPKGMIK